MININDIDALEEQRLKTNKQIKPCPFCGSHNVEQREHYDVFCNTGQQKIQYWIQCNNCFAASVCDEDIEKVIAAWNRRVV